MRRVVVMIVGLLVLAWAQSAVAGEHPTATLLIRGHAQTLHLYGVRGGDPVVVSSGDGGWIHLGPQVAEMLAAKGFFVVGFDAKSYLESFTSGDTTLRPVDEPGDYAVLAAWAARGSTKRPILVGVSEGAGLSVLAATDARTRQVVAGVIGLGLPDLNELGWRWRDSLIYLTHGVPKEPTFSTASLASRVSPAPLAAIHSTHDEYVPIGEVQQVMRVAGEPRRLWVLDASDHRFSDKLPELQRALLEAIDWVRAHEAK
jgi:alpha-beta hydrolase superfamily lysophospholipase